MIYAVKNNKVNRAIYKGNEDALTASIFERLMYLPQELMHQIIEKSLYSVVPKLSLNQIESVTFWPNWSAENTRNKNRVEPDIFIRTVSQDIIIEAKRYDLKQQNPDQWDNEIRAYFNEYAEDNKKLIFIALGGLHTTNTDVLKIGEIEHLIYKCQWSTLLNTIKDIQYQFQQIDTLTNSNKSINNIIDDIIMCFELFGFSAADWLERLQSPIKLNDSSLTLLEKPWTN